MVYRFKQFCSEKGFIADNLGAYMLFRYSTEFSEEFKPKHDLYLGVTLAKPYQQTTAGLVFVIDDIETTSRSDISFKDVFSIRLYYGFPLE